MHEKEAAILDEMKKSISVFDNQKHDNNNLVTALMKAEQQLESHCPQRISRKLCRKKEQEWETAESCMRAQLEELYRQKHKEKEMVQKKAKNTNTLKHT